MNGYENLANAIVLQAVEDYRTDVRKLKRIESEDVPQDEDERLEREKEMLKLRRDMSSVTRFLRSQWYTELTDVNGEIILRKLQEEADAL